MEFTVAGQNYKSVKLTALQQLHVARRLAPVFAGMAKAFAASQTADNGEVPNLDAIIEPVALAFGSLTDAESEYVLNACLDSVQRQQGQQGQVWAKIRAGNRLMFDDIGLSEMMQITVAVLQDNFASFFSGLPAQATAPNQA